MLPNAVKSYSNVNGMRLVFIDEPCCETIVKDLYAGTKVVGNGPIAVFRGPPLVYQSDMVAQDCGDSWAVWGVFPGTTKRSRRLSAEPYKVIPKPPK